MDALLKAQSATGQELLRLITNMRRDDGRPKTRSYYDQSRKDIIAVYKKYCKDDEILTAEDINKAPDQYLEERKEIQRAYKKAIEDINNCVTQLPSTTPKITPSSTIIVEKLWEMDEQPVKHQANIGSGVPIQSDTPLYNSDNDQQKQTSGSGEQQFKSSEADLNALRRLLKQQEVNMRLLYRKLDGINAKLTSNEYSEEYLKIKIDQINCEMKTIDQLHRSILVEVDEEDRYKYFTEDYYGTLQDKVETQVIELHRQIKMEKVDPSTTSSLKLPKVNIPTFYGEYENWHAFSDIFTRLIHQNSQLSNTLKMTYLKSHLQKGAAQLISHLSNIGDNYEKAWEILQTRYNNERLLASSYFNGILSLHHIQHATASSIRTLHDTVVEMLHNIKNLKLENPFEALITHLVMKKVDADTLERFESSLIHPRKIPNLDECLEFLTRRFQSLEASGGQKSSIARLTKPESSMPRKTFLNARSLSKSAADTSNCRYCGEQYHSVKNCIHFRNITIKRRIDFVNRAEICTNCLAHSRKIQCDEKPGCTSCHNRHHQLLHEPTDPRAAKTVSVSTSDGNQTTLLATAIVKINSICGTPLNIRTLIDQGSQVSLITEEAVHRLGLPLKQTAVRISGVGANTPNKANASVQICLQPHFDSAYRLKVDAYVLPKITTNIPEQPIARMPDDRWNGLRLADPNFDRPAPINLLLGADVYSDFIGSRIIRGRPSAISTSLGWIISGPSQTAIQQQTVAAHLSAVNQTEGGMEKFWELEEIPKGNGQESWSTEDSSCETLFQQTTKRGKDGRYSVQLPFKENQLDLLGSSRQRALQRFLHLEAKLCKNPKLRASYVEFMREYIQMGHMKQVDRGRGKFYLPHHAVVKHTTDDTKLRVVFDASMRTSTGVSLNEILCTGPSLQNDLWTVLLRWRKHRIVFTADIKKMYRQILVQKEHQQYQRILWRESKRHPIGEYQLTTVTYGTSAAPYLAIRTLHQLAEDEHCKYPEASHILKHDFYVDDVLTGADTMEKAVLVKSQLIDLLQQGGMELSKWSSNHPGLLKGLPKEQMLSGNLTITDEQQIKTLGIGYSPSADCFIFQVHLPPNDKKITKRQFLSEMSKIFDPLGWLAPLIIGCKIMYQRLWSLNLHWDEELPAETAKRWDQFKLELNAARQIKIPRYLNYTEDNGTFELLGFCDASEHAYAAVLYSKSTINGQCTIRLLTAKTRVAPIKSKLTIPRLELCGAVLLSRLVQQVKKSLEVNISATTLWSDSMITLAWIQKPSSSWKSFVAHRVAEIQQNTNIQSWHYIRSEDNPADCASRGVTSKQLTSLHSWWNGPSFLQDALTKGNEAKYETCEEKKNMVTAHLQVGNQESPVQTLINKQSSLRSLIRITIYILRWRTKRRGLIDQQEWDSALSRLVEAVQQVEFAEEYSLLKQGKPINKRSRIASLNPFLDKENTIRVGGRLENSSLPYEEKHPVILPYKGPFTKLVLDWGHNETLHGGNALTLAFIRKKFWIIRGVQAVKHNNHLCIRCHRFKVTGAEQLMGNLPIPRVTVSRPFTHTGVDYAGPIHIRTSKGRGNKSYKGYICIFICLATKAIHIEVASDLSTEGFISAFRRFTARRGNVAHMYSDNGTNFVGAQKLLQPLTWHFIPPAAPHFGGLWEAGVKSIKTHLKKCIGDTKLTFEEITTLLNQIEACLNSRPLCPLSEDPESLAVLTPGHFLIGDALLAPSENEPLSQHANVLSRWKLIQNMRTQFWQKWVSDYLHRLQQRPKWQQQRSNLKIGDIVLMRDELLPPTRWKLGRIIELHTGGDGQTRVVTLKSAGNSNIKRCISKVAPLPSPMPLKEDDTQEEQEHLAEDRESTTQKRRQQPSRKAKQTSSTNKVIRHTCLLLSIIGLVSGNRWSEESKSVETNPFIIVTSWNNSGMYFDNIAKAELLATKWDLVVRYNLSSYWQEIYNVEKGLSLLGSACKDVQPIKCDLIIQQLQWQFNNIIQDNVLLMHNDLSQHRTRRGIGDTIGRMMGDMFGILSQKEAEQYEEQFDLIQENEAYTLKLLKNQTSILDNTLKLFKHSNNITAMQLKQLMQEQHQLGAELALLNEYRTHQDKALAVTLLSLQLGLVIKHLEDTQRGLLDVLTGAKHQIIHPSLLSPLQLEQEMSTILKHLPKTCTIPGHGLLEIHNLYRLMTIRTRVTNNNAIIAIQIPLVQSWDYQLYEAISTPIFLHDSQIKIKPTTKYLLVDPYRERFAPITLQELNKCKELPDRLLVCDVATLYTPQSKHNQCEISMFLKSAVTHPSCIIENMKADHYFIKLQAANQWIFGANQTIKVDVICKSRIQTIALNHYGFIKLQPGCILRNNAVQLYAVSTTGSERSGSYIPAFNISVPTPLVGYNNHRSALTQQLNFTITTPNTTQLEQDIREQQVDESISIDHHHVHHYVMIHFVFWVLLVLGIFLVIRCLRVRRHKPQPPASCGRPPTCSTEHTTSV